MKDIFISYNQADASLAEALSDLFDRDKISNWLAPKEISAGHHYAENIPSAIKSCRIFLLIASESSLGSVEKNQAGSPEVIKELQLASNDRRYILPIKIDHIMDESFDQAATYHLATSQWLDVSQMTSLENQLQRITCIVKDLLASDNLDDFKSNFLHSANKNKQTHFLNEIETLLIQKKWMQAQKISSQNNFSEQYDDQVTVYRTMIEILRLGRLGKLSRSKADEIVLSLDVLKSGKYAAYAWLLQGNLSRSFYQPNGIIDPSEGWDMCKKKFMTFQRPRVSAKHMLILGHIPDIHRMYN